MSLLNDMLCDLARNRPVAAHMSHDSNELLQNTRLVKSKKASWVSAAVIFFLIFFLVLAVRQFIHKTSVPESTANVPVKNNEIKNTATEPSKVATPLVLAVEPHEAKAHAAISEAKVPANSQDDTSIKLRIDDLLQQANRALNMDRLTSPIEDNAYSYYQKILALNSNNDEALKGIEVIADRYLAKAQEQLQLGNHQQADVLIERARYVAEEYTNTFLGTGALNRIDHSISDEQSQYTQVEPIQQYTSHITEPIAQQPREIISQPRSESIKTLPVAEATPMTVVPNASWKDEQIAQQARELLQQGKIVEAQTSLKKFIASEQKPIQATIVLGDIYAQQNNFQAIEILATAATYLPDVEKAKMKAQLLANQGKETEAVGVLEQYINAADASESYRALLASLYHKTGNYQKSIISYQRLLNTYGEKPAYWLGVALAYDGLSQNNNALQAYLRLREFPQLQEQVKTYIEQRITALRGQ